MARIKVASRQWLVEHREQAIFVLLSCLAATFLVLDYFLKEDSFLSSLASNLAADAIFTIVTIYGITRITRHLRDVDNESFNDLIYREIRIELKRTMLKLLIELTAMDDQYAIRSDWVYEADEQIVSEFRNLASDLDVPLRRLTQDQESDIQKLLRVNELVGNCFRQIRSSVARLRSGSRSFDFVAQDGLFNVTDSNEYRRYLSTGYIYGPRDIYAQGRFKNVITDLHRDDWAHVLGATKSRMSSDFAALLEIYGACHTTL